MKWYKVFDSRQQARERIPLNRAVKVKAGGREICLARSNEGLFAVDNECPHLGESLSKGFCNAYNDIICPWHNYRFNLETGDETTNHGLMLNTYQLAVTDEGVFINI